MVLKMPESEWLIVAYSKKMAGLEKQSRRREVWNAVWVHIPPPSERFRKDVGIFLET